MGKVLGIVFVVILLAISLANPSKASDARTLLNLSGVHPYLVTIMVKAQTICPNTFVVIEGVRDEKRQAKLVRNGTSRTMDSEHLRGRAVDIAALKDGSIVWDMDYYHRAYACIRQASTSLGIPIVAGINWESFQDAGHYELPLDL